MYKKFRLNDFLTNYPLYKPFKAVENYSRIGEAYTHPFYIQGETFTYYCENELEYKTFEIEVIKSSVDFLGATPEGKIFDFFLTNDSNLDYTQHFIGKCKSCKEYKIDLLLHVWSDKPIPETEEQYMRQDIDGEWKPEEEFDKDRANIYIEKVGIKPIPSINLDPSVTKYFNRETNNLYYKAIKSKNENLGIASFAYFRRIIENELLNIVRSIAELNSSDNTKIINLISQYNTTEKIHEVYERVFSFLPKSLQILGDNPIKLLYKKTSEGLHTMSDAECLERAENIDLILKFVLKKINEENSEILNIKNAIKEMNK